MTESGPVGDRPIWRRAAISLTALAVAMVALPAALVLRDPSALLTFDTHYFVNALDYSSDGKLLVSVGVDGKLRFWDAESGALRKAVAADPDGVSTVAVAADGKSVATGGGSSTVRIWDVANGTLMRTLTGHSGKINAVRFSPDGRILASASDDKTVRLWDPTTGAAFRTLESEDSIRSLAFSPYGDALASGTDNGKIMLWSVADGTVRTTITVPPKEAESRAEAVWSLSFSPDGADLASGGSDSVVRVWRVSGGDLEHSWPVGYGSLEVAFAPDRRVLAVTGDAVRLWTFASAKPALSTTLPNGYPIAFSADGRRLASANNSGLSIKVWDVDAR